ncbi:MAG: hypothetical protein V4663_06120 [Bacteroidota bacterium]
MRRGTTPKELDAIKFEFFELEGEWFDAFDRPPTTGVWTIGGRTSNGKSVFNAKLGKMIAVEFNRKVIYNSREEGISASIQKTFRLVNMNEVSGRVLLVDETKDEAETRLQKRAYKDCVYIIDSFQYFNMTFTQFLAFVKRYPKVLFIVVIQYKGNEAIGVPAARVELDAALKILVEGHKAISKGRYIGKKGEYIIYREGAIKYHGFEAIEHENTN